MSGSGKKSGPRTLVKQRGQKGESNTLDPGSTELMGNAAST